MLRRRTRHGNADPASLSAAGIAIGWRLATLAAVAAAAAVLVACGGDDSSSAPPEGPQRSAPTRAEFLREADEICFSAESRIEAAADELVTGGSGPTPAERRRIARRIVAPGLEAEVEAIRALGTPPGDARVIRRILALTERGIERLRAAPLASGDRPPPPLRRAERLARRYGSRQCGLR